MTLMKAVFVKEPHGNQEIPKNGILGPSSCQFEAAHIFYEQVMSFVFSVITKELLWLTTVR